MIRGLADAGRIFKKQAYTQAAVRSADFVLGKMRDTNGHLLRNFAGGKANRLGYLDDYAYFVDGLIALDEATGDPRWLKLADELTADQIALFWDERAGGFFYTSTEHEQLIARSKLPIDGVTPSGNSVSVTNLLYLAKARRQAGVRRAGAAMRGIGGAGDPGEPGGRSATRRRPGAIARRDNGRRRSRAK